MAKVHGNDEVVDIKGLPDKDADFIRTAVRAAVEAALETEMTEALCAEEGERTEARLDCRSGYYHWSLITRVGALEIRMPQERARRFATALLERYQQSERALVGVLAEI